MSSSCAAIAGGDDVPIPDSRIELSAHIPRYTNLEIVFSTLGFADLSGDKQYINTGNRAEFIHGLEQLVAFLKRKWSRELEYRLIKELWASRKTELPFTLPMNGMTTQVNGIGPTATKTGNSMARASCTTDMHRSMIFRSRSRNGCFTGPKAGARMIIPG